MLVAPCDCVDVVEMLVLDFALAGGCVYGFPQPPCLSVCCLQGPLALSQG